MNPNTTSENPSIGPPVVTVSALNQAVARMLERSFPLTWIAGEISNFTRAASGHWYFTLKDDAAQVRAVMFRGRAQYAGFNPREGDQVEVRALVTLYAPRGDYQLSVEAIRRAGVGNLYEAFQRLKEKLATEGLFDPTRKRPLPLFAKTIGIVTSPQAAALRDILTTLQRRAPHVRIVLYSTPVQGQGAAEKIALAIDTASRRAECDVLLVCRGGGSIEDLWSFNEEVVARAIVRARMPVIVGVGHETDFTIADFSADLRAPTPTAAAEMAATPRLDWLAALQTHALGLHRAMQRGLGTAGQTVDWYARRLISPNATIRRERLRLQTLSLQLGHASRAPLQIATFHLGQLRVKLNSHRPDTQYLRAHLDTQSKRFCARISTQLRQRRDRLTSLATQLELLDPQRTLERGYAIVTDQQGRVLRAPAQLQPRQNLTLRLAQGSAQIGIATVQTSLE
ncbi:MAG: exodeoxyribonuclease VII large subunit [Pseudomonadota bacterium]